MMQNARLWFSRIVTIYALAIFTFQAYLYVAEPLEQMARFGISTSRVPELINFLRAGPGAFFAGMAITAAYGLARPTRLPSCLWILVLFNACVVAMHLLGIAVDGVTPMQMTGLRDDGLSWLLFVAAVALHPRTGAISGSASS